MRRVGDKGGQNLSDGERVVSGTGQGVTPPGDLVGHDWDSVSQSAVDGSSEGLLRDPGQEGAQTPLGPSPERYRGTVHGLDNDRDLYVDVCR